MSADSLRSGNLFANVPALLDIEETAVLAELPGARIERIVSTGQASAPGFWYDQDWTEWVVVLAGSAGLMIEGEDEPQSSGSRRLRGDPAARSPSRGMDRRR